MARRGVPGGGVPPVRHRSESVAVEAQGPGSLYSLSGCAAGGGHPAPFVTPEVVNALERHLRWLRKKRCVAAGASLVVVPERRGPPARRVMGQEAFKRTLKSAKLPAFWRPGADSRTCAAGITPPPGTVCRRITLQSGGGGNRTPVRRLRPGYPPRRRQMRGIPTMVSPARTRVTSRFQKIRNVSGTSAAYPASNRQHDYRRGVNSEGRGRAKRLCLPVFRPHEQTAKNDRDEQERGHVTEQVTAMRGGHRLNRHDGGVNDARPDCEPDQAAMGLRVSRRIQQEDAERRVYPDDHTEILGFIGSAGMPRPAGWPNDRQRIDQQEGCTEYGQGRLQEPVRGHQVSSLVGVTLRNGHLGRVGFNHLDVHRRHQRALASPCRFNRKRHARRE